MAIDYVHDTQQVFRKLLNSMSRPGTIIDLDVQSCVEGNLPCSQAMWLSILTLLDSEVTFHLIPSDNAEMMERVTAYTLAKPASAEEADFIIVLHASEEAEVIKAMGQCKIGSLPDPQISATWLIETEYLSEGTETLLIGPGIESEAMLNTGISSVILEARNERVKEYPLGVDLIFTDIRGKAAAIPRTTAIKVMEAGGWDM